MLEITSPRRKKTHDKKGRNMLHSKNYNQTVEGWEQAWIEQRARRFGLQSADVEDITQEVMIAFLEFQYDDQHQNCATKRTVLTSIVDKKISYFFRKWTRYEQVIGEFRDQMTPQEYDPSTAVELSVDIESAIEGCDPEEVTICRALADGKTPYEIARDRGCHWSRIGRITKRIRAKFEDRGVRAI